MESYGVKKWTRERERRKIFSKREWERLTENAHKFQLCMHRFFSPSNNFFFSSKGTLIAWKIYVCIFMWEFEERMSENALKRFPKNKIQQEDMKAWRNNRKICAFGSCKKIKRVEEIKAEIQHSSNFKLIVETKAGHQKKQKNKKNNSTHHRHI